MPAESPGKCAHEYLISNSMWLARYAQGMRMSGEITCVSDVFSLFLRTLHLRLVDMFAIDAQKLRGLLHHMTKVLRVNTL